MDRPATISVFKKTNRGTVGVNNLGRDDNEWWLEIDTRQYIKFNKYPPEDVMRELDERPNTKQNLNVCCSINALRNKNVTKDLPEPYSQFQR